MNILIGILAAIFGGGAGVVVTRTVLSKQLQSLKKKRSEFDTALENEKKELLLQAKDEALRIREQAKKEEEELKKEVKTLEASLRRREETLDNRASDLDEQLKQLKEREEHIEALKTELRGIRQKQEESLARIAKISKEEAKQILLDLVEKESKEDIGKRLQALERQGEESVEEKAREIIATVVERLASEQTSEMTVMPVPIPSEEMKGRIIGKEGRNIQAFEKASGVDVIIDETPEAITLSSFDPVRRYVASIAMQKLIKDGRIHPARIEEIIEKTTEEVQTETKKAGEDAAYRAQVTGLPPEIVKILGRLKFRTSYGQNQLEHAVEVANLAGMISDEIGADTKIVRRAALLHDLGKAVDHDVPGPHHHISGDIARKYGIDEPTIHAIMAHHDDIPAETVEAFCVKSADAISGARPGARRESLERYLQRMKDLENLVNSFDGVEKSFAIQAGREVRVFVRPEELNDLEAARLSRQVADKIEQDLSYPGQIKITLIRETRAIEYAR